MSTFDIKNNDDCPRGRGDGGKYHHHHHRRRRGGIGGGNSGNKIKQYNNDNKNKKRSSNELNNVKRTKYESSSNRLKEIDIGVSEFMGTHKHFTGIFKERFSDFNVHEIDCNGKIATLTTQEIPPEPEDDIDVDKLKKSLPIDILEKLDNFTNSETDDVDNPVTSIEIDVTSIDKDHRRNIHTIAKKIKQVNSQTIDRDNKKLLVLTKTNNDSNKKKINTLYKKYGFHRDIRINWSLREGPYCKFILHKVNLDTMDALNQLAVNLRIRPNFLNYSGTKDRRGCTTQWVTAKQIHPSLILEAGKRIRGVYVGNFEFTKNSLKLGMLKGNHFTIALRNITTSDQEIESAIINLRDYGFINYYGLQRFGSVAAIPTHEIGKALLKANYNEAIDLILKPRSGDYKDMADAREIYYKTKDASKALKCINRLDKIEAKLLKGIELNGISNPQGALDYIPRNIRLMYIHSYQSFIWNHIVSRRIQKFGRKPIVGDLVYATQSNLDKKQQQKFQVNDEEFNEILNNDNDDKIDIDFEDDEKSLPEVKIINQSDLSNYTFADIIIPLPGHKVIYPSYAKVWYEEFMDKDNLNIDLKNKNKKYSLSGAYRKIIQVPDNLSWKILRYNDINSDLILSDIDKFRGNEEKIKQISEGKYKALILEMSLKSSTYATMALREILNHDTSAETQAAQTAAYHHDASVNQQELNEKNDFNDENEQFQNQDIKKDNVIELEKKQLMETDEAIVKA
ncbi:pseudouridylate synthase 7 homolog [Microplitis demolitor]|uniref:pseudouridylate synthase 7 homolog n=1 Tax=Microplitis demolitor TaxID=69319 RepID=UPI0004CDD335|nr:pseudouridylate synthase 7 homolog [Microplitis demolitor]XP_053596484.1 pseudouridylate synthase 7 homolog [Microplitis demolitor]